MKRKRILSLLLSIVMIFALLTVPVFAEETEAKTTDAYISVPSDSKLYVGLKDKAHFVSFTEIKADLTVEDEAAGTTTYYFTLEPNRTYNYRVSSEDYITYAGKFKKTADFSLAITEEMLASEGKTKKTIDRDVTSNNGYNVADIYLNINPQGYLKLDSVNDTYQLINLRSWEAVDTITANYFIEPDYHYTVIDENGNISDSVVTVSEGGLITAVGEGSAIVLVTYDALNYDGAAGGPFFGAIWPENTGVFVVSVGAGESGISTGMTINEGKNKETIKLSGDKIDAEHDVIYFTGDNGSYTFTPETEGVKVFAANPVVGDAVSFNGFKEIAKNADDSFSAPLAEGRNIIKLEKDGKAEYQIITAKRVNITINNGEAVRPGDALSIVFDTLYHPANKLAGVYNMNALPVYSAVSAYESTLIGGLPNQYAFASNLSTQTVANVLQEKNQWGMITYGKAADLTVPEDYAFDTFTLSGGVIYSTGFGDAYGNHRGITLADGKAPNFTSEARLGWFGRLPDIEIPVTVSDAELSGITLDTQNLKTDYFAGESLDAAGLVVNANYADGATQIATNYTISPEVISEDTKAITVTYRGKTAQIPINVIPVEASAIEITTPPAKTSYTAGDTFDPTGMVVSVVYNNNTKAVTTDYSYSPNRELTAEDTEITITYTTAEKQLIATTPITVAEASGEGTSVPSSSKNITVYFTLLGDTKHGEPSDESQTHTNTDKNLETWLKKTSVTVKKGSYVIDVVTKALSLNGIPYTNEDENYITSVKGLYEFDNGAASGWMYTLNGKYPKLGIAEQTVKNGDKIVLHYTDDYTKEEDEKLFSSGGGGFGGSASSNKKDEKDENTGKDTAKYILNTVTEPQVGSVGGEWAVLGLARGGYDVPDGYYKNYYNAVESYVKECGGVLHKKKYTEYSRVILALGAIGADVTNVGGYNLLYPLADYEKTVWQGTNGPVWALIALDSKNYEIPANSEAKTIATRQMYIDKILSAQNADGGFSLSESAGESDIDVTAMALCALAGYTDNETVKTATDNAVLFLSKAQNENGGFSNQGYENSESVIQVICALCALGISPDDSRFVKNGNTLLDNLMSYKAENGGFEHIQNGGVNLMASEQALYALAAVKRFEEGSNTLYDMSDTPAQNYGMYNRIANIIFNIVKRVYLVLR